MKKHEKQIRQELLHVPQPGKNWEERLIREAVARPQSGITAIIGIFVRSANALGGLFRRQPLLAPALAAGCLLMLIVWNPLDTYRVPGGSASEDALYRNAISYTEEITGVNDALPEEEILEEINAWIPQDW